MTRRKRRAKKYPSDYYSNYKYGAKQRQLLFQITKEEFENLWEKPCHYCNSPIETIGLDRVDNNKGYVIENIVPCCKICNFMKAQLNKKDFVNQCKLVTTTFV